MDSAKVREPKAKSLFELDSDDETRNEENSVVVGSVELSPLLNGGNEVAETEVGLQLGNDFESRENDGSTGQEVALSAFQKAKIERNRQKALLLRQARLQAHPYKK